MNDFYGKKAQKYKYKYLKLKEYSGGGGASNIDPSHYSKAMTTCLFSKFLGQTINYPLRYESVNGQVTFMSPKEADQRIAQGPLPLTGSQIASQTGSQSIYSSQAPRAVSPSMYSILPNDSARAVQFAEGHTSVIIPPTITGSQTGLQRGSQSPISSRPSSRQPQTPLPPPPRSVVEPQSLSLSQSSAASTTDLELTKMMEEVLAESFKLSPTPQSRPQSPQPQSRTRTQAPELMSLSQINNQPQQAQKLVQETQSLTSARSLTPPPPRRSVVEPQSLSLSQSPPMYSRPQSIYSLPPPRPPLPQSVPNVLQGVKYYQTKGERVPLVDYKSPPSSPVPPPQSFISLSPTTSRSLSPTSQSLSAIQAATYKNTEWSPARPV